MRSVRSRNGVTLTLAAVLAAAGCTVAGCGTRHIYRNPGKHYVIKSENRVAAEKAEEAQEARDAPESLTTTHSNTQPNLEEKVGGGETEQQYVVADEETYKQWQTVYMQGMHMFKVGFDASDLTKIVRAEDLFQKSHEVNPTRTTSLYMIGNCYLQMARLTAENAMKKKHCSTAIAYLEEGLSVAERNIKAKADGVALREDPHWEKEGCIKLLATVYEEMGDTKKAREYRGLLAASEEIASTE